MPGNLHGWIGYEIAFDKPMLLRAGGELRAGRDAAGPSGLTGSDYEKGLAVRRADFQFRGNSRVMNMAPYLALIGRICSREICSAPFLLDRARCSVLAHQREGRAAALDEQLRPARRIPDAAAVLARLRRLPVPDRRRARGRLRTWANVGGGAATPRSDVAALDAGQVLKESGFIVSSRQTSWKPFFLPLDRALVIRASGYMQPREAVSEPTRTASSCRTDASGVSGRELGRGGRRARAVDRGCPIKRSSAVVCNARRAATRFSSVPNGPSVQRRSTSASSSGSTTSSSRPARASSTSTCSRSSRDAASTASKCRGRPRERAGNSRRGSKAQGGTGSRLEAQGSKAREVSQGKEAERQKA